MPNVCTHSHSKCVKTPLNLCRKKEGNWVELTFAKTCGTVTRDREKNWPIADRYLVTMPETIVGCISAPVPFSFLKWRITVIENSTRENVSAQIKSDSL